MSGPMLCGCSPRDAGLVATRASGPAAGVTSRAGAGRQVPADTSPSYEVIIASAGADRVRAREVCDAKLKLERAACNLEVDAAYDQAKQAAERAGDSVR